MLRTQIYLPEEYRTELNYIAKKTGTSMARVIRKIIKEGLSNKEKLLGTGNDLFSLSKLKLKGGPKDLSSRIDYYLYGEGK